MKRPDPYLWRYQEEHPNPEVITMDVLLLLEPERFDDEPGELTIVWWD